MFLWPQLSEFSGLHILFCCYYRLLRHGNVFGALCLSVCLSVCNSNAITFESLDLEISSLVRWYIFKIPRSSSFIKVIKDHRSKRRYRCILFVDGLHSTERESCLLMLQLTMTVFLSCDAFSAKFGLFHSVCLSVWLHDCDSFEFRPIWKRLINISLHYSYHSVPPPF